MPKGVQIAFTLNPKEFIRGLKRIDVDLENVKDTMESVGDAGDDAFDLQTRDAERGLGDVEDAAEDAEKALDDLGTGAKTELGKVEAAATAAGAEVESEIKDGSKDAEKALGKLGASAKSDMAKVEKSSKKAADEVDEVGQEATSSAREFGSSFRGDPIEALEEVQSLGAEIAAQTIPGIGGAAVAIAGGLVFGFITSQFERLREEAEELREKVVELRDRFLDLEDVEFADLGQQSVVDDLIEQLEKAGVTLETLTGQIEDTSPRAQAAWKRFTDTQTLEDFQAFVGALRTDINTVGDDFDAASIDVLNAIGPLGKALGLATEEAELQDAVFADLTDQTEELAGRIDDATQAIQELGEEFTEADAAGDEFAAQLDETQEAVEELTKEGRVFNGTLDNTTEGQRDAKDALRDMADATLDTAAAQVELDGSTAQAARTTAKGRDAVIEAGKAMGLSQSDAEDYARELGLIPSEVATSIKVTDDGTVKKTQDKINGIQGKIVYMGVVTTPRDVLTQRLIDKGLV